MGFLAVIVVVCLAATAWFHHLMKPTGKKLPPGPHPLPIVGNIFQVAGTQPHKTFQQLSNKYGPLMSIRLGSLLTVVVTSPEMVKEVLSRQEFTGRHIGLSARAHDHHKLSMGFVPVSSDRWRMLRKISKEQLFATHSLEKSQSLRQEKLQQLLEFVQRRCDAGRAVNIGEASFTSILNFMSATFFTSEDVEFDSSATAELKEIIEGIATAVTLPSYADYFPILEPFDPLGVKRMSDLYFGRLLSFINIHIDRRLESRKASPNAPKPNDFLETLLDISVGGSDDKLTLNDIAHLLLDLYVAGTESTALTVEWVMTELLCHPHMLSKVKNEVRNLLGDRKMIKDEDISRLPYLEAVIKEVFRHRTPSPLLVPRTAEKDTEINGYFIPKGTQIIVNAWAIGRDPSVWTSPESFDPDRFLNTDVNLKGQFYQLTPFGSGKRICPGMPFAQRSMPSVVAALVHNFDWEYAPRGENERKGEFLSGGGLRRVASLMAIPLKPLP